MDSGSHGGVLGQHCATCQRFWFDLEDAPRVVREASASATVSISLTPVEGRGFRCPRCRVELEDRFFNADTSIHFTRCRQCSGTSITRAALESAEARTAEVHRETRDRLRRSADRKQRLGTSRTSSPSSLPSGPSDGPQPLFVKSTSPFFWLFGAPAMETRARTRKLFGTFGVMAVLVLIFCWQILGPLGLKGSADLLGMVPADVLAGKRLWTLVTSILVHGGLGHILGNLYFLFIFGANAEERMGTLGFLALFLAAGLAGNGLTLLEWSHRTDPGVGASGAIAGVMGASAILAPSRRIYVPVFRWFFTTWLMVLPAWVFLLVWAFGNLLLGTMHSDAMIGYWDHAGGFLLGICVVGSLRVAGFLEDPSAR